MTWPSHLANWQYMRLQPIAKLPWVFVTLVSHALTIFSYTPNPESDTFWTGFDVMCVCEMHYPKERFSLNLCRRQIDQFNTLYSSHDKDLQTKNTRKSIFFLLAIFFIFPQNSSERDFILFGSPEMKKRIESYFFK